MKSAIVTGANGFIGSAVVRELIAHGVEVIAIHREGRDSNIPSSQLVVKIALDTKNIEQLSERNITADVFYHFAWDGVSGDARADVKTQLDNIGMTLSCLKTAKSVGCKRFIYAASIVEAESLAACTAQGLRPGKGYIYGTIKQTTNHITQMMAADYGIEYIAGMISNTYGIGEHSSRLMITTMRQILERKPVQFTSGTQMYDFVYITDVAKAFRLIAERGKPFCEYMIGSGKPKPLREFLLEMQKLIAPTHEFLFGNIPFTGVSLPAETYDISLLQAHCDYVPEISFASGVQKLYDWLLQTSTPPT